MSALTPSSRLSVLRTVFQRQRSVGTHMKIMRPLRLYSTTSTLQGSSQEIPMTPSYSAKLTDTDIDVSETRSLITREQLHKLHTLSALNPPPENSAEEQDLIEELSGLIGLMNQVQDVPLPSSLEERAELLSRGMGQVVVSQESLDRLDEERHRDQARSKSEKASTAASQASPNESQRKVGKSF